MVEIFRKFAKLNEYKNTLQRVSMRFAEKHSKEKFVTVTWKTTAKRTFAYCLYLSQT